MVTWIFLLKAKFEAIFIFETFKTTVELQLNTKIKAIQTDWGGEFCTSSLADVPLNIHPMVTRSMSGIAKPRQVPTV